MLLSTVVVCGGTLTQTTTTKKTYAFMSSSPSSVNINPFKMCMNCLHNQNVLPPFCWVRVYKKLGFFSTIFIVPPHKETVLLLLALCFLLIFSQIQTHTHTYIYTIKCSRGVENPILLNSTNIFQNINDASSSNTEV